MNTFLAFIGLLLMTVGVAGMYKDANKKDVYVNGQVSTTDVQNTPSQFIPIKDKDGAVIGGVHNPEYYSPSKR